MPLPEWFDQRRENNSTSARLEKARAKEKGGKRQAGSGNTKYAPQDIKDDNELEQHKFTRKHRFTLDARELKATMRDATVNGRNPSMCVEFLEDDIRVVMSIERRVTK